MLEIGKMNIICAIVVCIILFICCLLFVFRIAGLQKVESVLGIVLIAGIIPLVFLLFKANDSNRSTLYYIQIVLMISFLVLELFFDYIFHLEFRKNITWVTVIYLVLYYSGTGGMVGIASLAGRLWIYIAAGLFFIMTGLSFLQRYITGL